MGLLVQRGDILHRGYGYAAVCCLARAQDQGRTQQIAFSGWDLQAA